MDRSSKAVLINQTYTEDAIGQRIAAETRTSVFCSVESVSRAEWNTAGQNGLKAELKLTMFGPEYSGQAICEVDGVRYGVYRTYRLKNDGIELYLERKAGA